MDGQQLTCRLHWIPGKNKFDFNKPFKALGKFTSDYDVAYTIEVTYSADCLYGYHNATLKIPFAEPDELKRLIFHSNIIILDGFIIIAVCNSITIKE